MSNAERFETFMLFLGDLCDSPDSLRGHIAMACEEIAAKRLKEGKTYPKWVGRWKPFLNKREETTSDEKPGVDS